MTGKFNGKKYFFGLNLKYFDSTHGDKGREKIS